ncbi:ABC-type xylose transport system, permease component [Pseudomonas amygdali pv. mori]|uniref:sugar ABC transporter permease n=1 Tax=Pseudomonas amygdali TaxID=47877 RepID=UPI000F3D0D6B|nr:hypothetical protein [Pseudomonas amygdali]RMR49065.1 ABC-type xylose transport system, permease component [Pseudomonas amygdali pv. mori]
MSQTNETATLLDRSDSRVNQTVGLAASLKATAERIRAGDLGPLPVVIGLVVIWTAFGVLNPVFLSSANLSNLLFDAATVGIISLGVVCVLMVGEIDLSVGSISGFASALVGVLWVNQGWPVGLAILAALVAGALIGSLYSLLFTRLGMPSFVASLAGLLTVLGLQLQVLGNAGSINLPYDSFLVSFGQLDTLPPLLAYLLAGLTGTLRFFNGYRERARRRQAQLSSPSLVGLALQSLALTVLLGSVAYYLNQDRGVPWIFAFFVALVVAMNYAFTRTRWGRSLIAVGGNREAARRAGINVRRIYTSAFVLCASLAALGGILAAARWPRPVSRRGPVTSTSMPSPRR